MGRNRGVEMGGVHCPTCVCRIESSMYGRVRVGRMLDGYVWEMYGEVIFEDVCVNACGGLRSV